MRDYAKELEARIAFIRSAVESAHAKGIVYGNSGGKDSALVGILCKMACENTVGVIMPCASKRNFGEDMEHGIEVAKQFDLPVLARLPINPAVAEAFDAGMMETVSTEHLADAVAAVEKA